MAQNNKLSDHFSRDDFACTCGRCNKEFRMSLGIIGILEHLQTRFQQPITIQRAYVCEEQSKALFSSSKDYHHMGKAVDISIENTPLEEIFKEIESMPEVTGIGFIPQSKQIHIDLRDKDREVWLEERDEKLPLSPQKRQQYNL
jgi:uncharacterized protein YcbK (DUF882 family)